MSASRAPKRPPKNSYGVAAEAILNEILVNSIINRAHLVGILRLNAEILANLTSRDHDEVSEHYYSHVEKLFREYQTAFLVKHADLPDIRGILNNLFSGDGAGTPPAPDSEKPE